MRYGRLRLHVVIWLVGLALALAVNQGAILLLPALLSILVEARARRRQASDIPHRDAPAWSSPRPDATTPPPSVRIDGSATVKGNIVAGSMISADDANMLEDMHRIPGKRSGGVVIHGESIVVGGDLVGGDKIVIGRQAALSLADWLPTNCPNCGGPLSTTTVKNSTATTAECPFCGTQLRLTPRL